MSADLLSHLKSDLAEIRAEIRSMNSTVRELMTEQTGAISKLTERSEYAERNIAELWNQLNDTRSKADALEAQIRSIEGSAAGASKLMAIIFGIVGAAGALVAILR